MENKDKWLQILSESLIASIDVYVKYKKQWEVVDCKWDDKNYIISFCCLWYTLLIHIYLTKKSDYIYYDIKDKYEKIFKS